MSELHAQAVRRGLAASVGSPEPTGNVSIDQHAIAALGSSTAVMINALQVMRDAILNAATR